jgi:hypothetical protein
LILVLKVVLSNNVYMFVIKLIILFHFVRIACCLKCPYSGPVFLEAEFCQLGVKIHSLVYIYTPIVNLHHFGVNTDAKEITPTSAHTSASLHLLSVNSEAIAIAPSWCKNTLTGVYLRLKCKFTPSWCNYRGKRNYTNSV